MKSSAELRELNEKFKSGRKLGPDTEKIRVNVGLATCGIAAGAEPIFEFLKEQVKEEKPGGMLPARVGCIGLCKYEPIIEVLVPGRPKVTYVNMTVDKMREVIEKHIIGGEVVEEYTVGAGMGERGVTNIADTDFMKHQTRVALRNCGVVDPQSIEEYIAADGYQALERVLLGGMTPEDVIRTVTDSGVRGRGGAGFPTGLKWKFASAPAPVKYVCCNADEGDPGAFMDRSVLEGDPHAVLEAMTIAGYAIGAHQGYIYVRAEYPLAVKRLNIAIREANERGLLGKDILGSGFDFDIGLRLGSGAFVCGEETALMTSIEGKRGEPRPRPPFPAVKGLFDKPTILNNVETWANIPRIILKGAKWFAAMGTERSKGTKVFSLVGNINNTGLVEVPMGTPLRQVVEVIGGGLPDGRTFKAAQTGGPSGGCIPASLIDTPIDYESLSDIGSIVGSGGLIIMDEGSCMVDIAKFYLQFTMEESCGKCTPCRIGTRRLYEMISDITDGRADEKTLSDMEDLCRHVAANSLCGLGQTAPNPVISTLRYFRGEYEAHVKEKRCPAGVCRNLLRYGIYKDKCIGCGMCAGQCPSDAIYKTDYIGPGRKLPAYGIDIEKCVKCGACMSACRFDAVGKR